MTKNALVCICAAAFVSGCGGDSPTSPSGTSTVTFQQVTPASGSTIIVSQGNPPGAFIVRGSGQLTIPMAIRTTRDADFAALSVYLLSGIDPESFCGQNLPDMPTWGPWIPRRTVQVSVSGFQVFRLPCEVTGIRAILHLGQGGLSVLRTPTLRLADETLPVTLFLRR